MKLINKLSFDETEIIGSWYMNSKIDQKNISVADDGTITVTGASKYLETGKEYYFYSFLQYYSNKGTAFGFGKPVKKTKIADKNDVELVITIYSEEEFGGDDPEDPDDPTIYFTISFFVSDDADAKFEDYEPFMIDGKAAVKTGSFKASEGSTTGEELMRSAFNSVSDVLYAANYTQEFLDDTESDDHNLVHKYYFVKKPNAGFEVEFEIVRTDDYTQMINLRWDENTGAFACESGFTSYTWFLDGHEVTAETDAARPTTTYIPDLSRLNSGTHTVAVTVTVAGSDDKVDSYTATGSFEVYEE